ncbi:MAG: tetratricopeptide repeat protein, partial [Cyclobacteriaceae bacterium]|nr:tetratricopeptide repeat protein [Cyclobacteriaceae bacterium]
MFFDHIELLRWVNENQQAIDQLTEFLDKKGYKDNKVYLLSAYNEMAENYRWLGDTEHALSVLKEVEKVYQEEPSLEKTEFVRFIFYKGKVYRSKNLLDSAEYYHRKALDLAKQYNYHEHALVGEIWMDLGYIQTYYIGDIQIAIIFNSNAQNNFLKTLDKWHIKRAVVYYELARNYRELGDFERSVNYARMAELIYSYHGDQFISHQINSKAVQGSCYFDNGNFNEANAVYEDVIEIYTNEVNPPRGALVRTLFNNGVALFNLEEYEKARKSIERSIELNPLLYDTDSLDLVYAYSNLALILEELNQFDKAKELLEKCLLISLKLFGEKHIEVFEGYRYLGMNYAKQDQLEKALFYYQMALIAAFKDFDDKNIFTNPSSFDSIPKGAAFNILFDKARAFKKKYERDKNNEDLLAAFDLYVIAYKLIREAANSDFMEESLLNIPETFNDDLNYGVECALALYESTNDQKYLDQLIQFVETNKYFLLQNSVAKSKSKETLGIPDSAYQKEKDLLEQINTLKQEINNTSFEDAQEEYDKRLELLNTTIEWDNIRKQWDPSDDANFTFTDLSSTISLDSIRSQLIRESDVLLEYFQTLDTLYTIVIDKDQERILKTPKTKELEIQMDTYLEHMFNKGSSNSKDDFIKFVNASYFLYKKLVYPAISISNVSQGIDGPKRLIIIPDGKLSYMPFESLIQEPADSTYENYWALNYLCNDYIINYAYSVNILSNNLLTETYDRKLRILAFSYSSSNTDDSGGERYDPHGELPFSAEELKSINKWIKKGKFYEGNLATEYVFKSNVQDHDIIHLAVHGFGDTVDILNSHLVFKDPG